MGASTLQLVLCFLLLSAVVQAVDDPPKFVYRMDFRGPDIIFDKGFQPLGDNDNLYQHVNGDSCNSGTADTAFVATTSDKQFAMDWVKNSFCSKKRETADKYYVYTIQATKKFYNAHASLLKTGEKKNRELANRFKNENEWLAFEGVPAKRIQKADIYSIPKYVQTGTKMNTGYVKITESSANSDPYISKPKEQPPRRFALSEFITACFTCGEAASTTQSTAKNEKTEAKISIASLLKNLFQFASSN